MYKGESEELFLKLDTKKLPDLELFLLIDNSVYNNNFLELNEEAKKFNKMGIPKDPQRVIEEYEECLNDIFGNVSLPEEKDFFIVRNPIKMTVNSDNNTYKEISQNSVENLSIARYSFLTSTLLKNEKIKVMNECRKRFEESGIEPKDEDEMYMLLNTFLKEIIIEKMFNNNSSKSPLIINISLN